MRSLVEGIHDRRRFAGDQAGSYRSTRPTRRTRRLSSIRKGGPMSTTHRPRKLATVASIAAASLIAVHGRLSAAPRTPDIVVTTVAELVGALVPANAGARILVVAGDYDVSVPLVVPDGATLEGQGVMSYDPSGLPAEIEPSGRTLLRSTLALVGDMLTLGDGSSLHGLVIEDALGRASGNLVAVVSRAAGAIISARVDECEMVNPNPSGVAPQGPTGRSLVAVARNLNLGQDPPPH